MGGIGDWLAMIDEANQAGANITTETLSYAAGGTSISADVFRRRDWFRSCKAKHLGLKLPTIGFMISSSMVFALMLQLAK